MAAASESKPDIILNSPVGSKPATYKWPLTHISKGQKIDGAEEIIETIRWVAKEYVEFKPAIENLLPEQPNLRSYDCIKSLCDKYNKILDMVMKMNKGTSVALRTNSSRAPPGLLRHIIQQVYNYAVADPTELNKYSPFSSETYGETSFEFMAQLIDKNQFRPKENDTFIDMGSGVGHLVLQMAATVECKKCYGIEKSDVPAGYAKVMEERFRFWMNWHGKMFTEFELIHGDFFEKKYQDIIKSSTYILVNNFAFKPEVDHKLKQKFLDLKDGTQILSSKPFCSPKARITERNLTDIGSIMRVVEIQPETKKDAVSWTSKPLPYYLHVLDGSPVEKYYERQKRKQGRSIVQDKAGKPSSKRKRTAKAGSESYSDDSDDNNIVYGPTTRKAWSEWCNASSVSASNNRASVDSTKTGNSSRNNSTDTENLSESAMGETGKSIAPSKSRDPETQKRDKRTESQNSDRASTSSHGTGSQKANHKETPKSCLDKKRDYAIKKSGNTSLLQSAPPSALYSISKPADTSSGSSTSKIPNIVIKVKPPIEPKPSTVAGPSSGSASPSKLDVKMNDENGKKLRQRKKSTAPSQSESEPSSPSKTSSSSKQTSGASASAKTTTTATTKRTRKTSATATTTATTAAPSKPKSATASNSRRKAVIPPEKSYSLDLLHAKTIESVSGSLGYYAHPAPGCEDHSLKSIKDTPSLPKVVIKDPSMFASSFLSSKNIDKYLNETRKELENFAVKLQQPHSRESLIKGIEYERMRNRDLVRAEDELNRHIRHLNDKVPRALRAHCDDLQIKCSPRNLVLHLGALLKKHQDLTAYQMQLETTLQPNQRTMNPPAAHSSSSSVGGGGGSVTSGGPSLVSPYAAAAGAATLDLSLK